MFTLLRLSLLYLCTHASYVTFNTDLNFAVRKKIYYYQLDAFQLVGLGLPILSECENEQIVLFIIRINPNMGNLMDLSLKYFKSYFWYLATSHNLYINYACNLHSYVS